MTRSPDARVAQRINGALQVIKKFSSDAKAVAALVRRYRVSRRQAYRYIREAQTTKTPLPIPERKIHFTVKLPFRMVHRFRQLARTTGESLSTLVERALESFLQREGRG